MSRARRRAFRTIRPAIDIAALRWSSDDVFIIAEIAGRIGQPGARMIRPWPSCGADSIRRARRAAPTGRRWTRSSRTCERRQTEVAGRGAGGDERSIARHRERGKLPVRERIDRLIDPGSAVPRTEPARRQRSLRRRRARRRAS